MRRVSFSFCMSFRMLVQVSLGFVSEEICQVDHAYTGMHLLRMANPNLELKSPWSSFGFAIHGASVSVKV